MNWPLPTPSFYPSSSPFSEPFEQLKAYLYVIKDVRDFPVNFFGILTSLAKSRSEQSKFFDDKMSRCVVGIGKLAETIVKGASQSQYGGNRDAFLAHTIEEAIAAAQSEYQSNGWLSLEL